MHCAYINVCWLLISAQKDTSLLWFLKINCTSCNEVYWNQVVRMYVHLPHLWISPEPLNHANKLDMMVRTSSSWPRVIAFLMAKGTVRVQILREYFCGQYFLNHVTFVSETDSIMEHHHDPKCHANRLGSYLQGRGHNVGSDPKKTELFLPYLLNFWTCCNQTWYSDASSRAGVFCVICLLLPSWWRSQWGLQSSGIIFRTSQTTGGILPHEATSCFKTFICRGMWISFPQWKCMSYAKRMLHICTHVQCNTCKILSFMSKAQVWCDVQILHYTKNVCQRIEVRI